MDELHSIKSSLNEIFRNHSTTPTVSTSFDNPMIELHCDNSESFLREASTLTGENVYEHLRQIIAKILIDRPANVIDYFEEFSRSVREERYTPEEIKIMKRCANDINTLVSTKILHVLKENEKLLRLPNSLLKEISKRLHLWSSAGLGFSHEVNLQISCSIYNAFKGHHFNEFRLWGIIYGINCKYYIAEGYSVRMGEKDNLSDDSTVCSTIRSNTPSEIAPDRESKASIEDMPNDQKNDAIDVNGKNEINLKWFRRTYFVCKDLDKNEWIELPKPTANQIVQSIQIRKFLRENLDEEVNSFPKFDGKLINYLAAIITRISHGTTVRSLDFDVTNSQNMLLNASNWIHTFPEIDENGKFQSASDGATADTDLEHIKFCNEDVSPCIGKAWKFNFVEDFSTPETIVLAESLTWNGSYTMVSEKITETAYFGFGHKVSMTNFVPNIDFNVQNECSNANYI